MSNTFTWGRDVAWWLSGWYGIRLFEGGKGAHVNEGLAGWLAVRLGGSPGAAVHLGLRLYTSFRDTVADGNAWQVATSLIVIPLSSSPIHLKRCEPQMMWFHSWLDPIRLPGSYPIPPITQGGR